MTIPSLVPMHELTCTPAGWAGHSCVFLLIYTTSGLYKWEFFVAMHHMDSREIVVTSDNNNSTNHHKACSRPGVHL